MPTPGSTIDDVNCARRKIAVGICNRERPVENVERRNVMIDVHDARGRIDVEDHALHGADQVIARAEIRGESDDGIGQRESPVQDGVRKLHENRGAFYSFARYRRGSSVSRRRARSLRSERPARGGIAETYAPFGCQGSP